MGSNPICGTEHYAKCLAKEEREWHEKYDSLIRKKIELFDKLICVHKTEAYDMVERLIDDAMTEEVQTRDTNYAYMVVFVQIYRAERKNNEQRFFFDYGDSLTELIDVYQQIKFWLWEMEFLQDNSASEMLGQFVLEYEISSELLRNMILVACVDKEQMKSRVRELTGKDL